MQKVTLKQVAIECGFTPQTVGRILNQDQGHCYHPETVALVKASAEKLGYSPNYLARSLLKGTSDTFGIIMAEKENDNVWTLFWSGIIRGANRELQKSGKRLLIVSPVEGKSAVDTGIQLIHNRCIDGLLVPYFLVNAEEFEKLKSVPSVVIESYENHTIPTVKMDPEPGLKALAEHFKEKRYGTVLWLCDDPDLNVLFEIPRTQAFLKAAIDNGIQVDKLNIPQYDKDSFEQNFQVLLNRAKEQVTGYIATHPLPRAIAAYREVLAIGVAEALKEQGIKIPDQVAVAGFDNLYGSLYHPQLTAVDYGLEEIGEAAVKMLGDILDGKAVKNIQVPSQLYIGKST